MHDDRFGKQQRRKPKMQKILGHLVDDFLCRTGSCGERIKVGLSLGIKKIRGDLGNTFRPGFFTDLSQPPGSLGKGAQFSRCLYIRVRAKDLLEKRRA